MLSKLNSSLEDLFTLPVIITDSALKIHSVNAAFIALFGDVSGQNLAEISPDFNERKLHRRLSQGSDYRCRLAAVSDRQDHYALELTRADDQYIGFAINASEAVKAEMMLASYSEMVERQNREIKEKNAQISVWRQRIENELRQAESVQELLVPKQLSTSFLDSRCEPLQELSGDFHEYVTHASGEVTFISGDVAGKGIHAAIVLAQTLTAFRACYAETELPQLAARMVDMLEGRFPDGLFVAFTLVRLSPDKSTATLLNLGNPDAIALSADGEALCFASSGPAIGIFPSAVYTALNTEQVSLKDRRLYVFSDGVLDINLGPQHKGFSSSKDVIAYLLSLEEKGLEDVLDRLMGDVRQNPQTDDVTIACFTQGKEDIPAVTQTPILPKVEFSSFFSIPLVRLDSAFVISEMNEPFLSLFSAALGEHISRFATDFNLRKAERKLASAEPYIFTLASSDAQKTPYRVELKPFGDDYIGYATDSSGAAKAEAMLESYSAIMEKQVKILQVEDKKNNALLSSLLPNQILTELRSLQGSKPQLYLNMPMMLITITGPSELMAFEDTKEQLSIIDEYLTCLDILAEEKGFMRFSIERGNAVILPLFANSVEQDNTINPSLSLIELCSEMIQIGELQTGELNFSSRISLHFGHVITAITGKQRLSLNMFGAAIEELVGLHQQTVIGECIASDAFFQHCEKDLAHQPARHAFSAVKEKTESDSSLYNAPRHRLMLSAEDKQEMLADIIEKAKRTIRPGK